MTEPTSETARQPNLVQSAVVKGPMMNCTLKEIEPIQAAREQNREFAVRVPYCEVE